MSVTRGSHRVDERFEQAGIDVRHAPLLGFFDWHSVRELTSIFKESERTPVIVHVHRYRDAMTALLARRMAHRPDIRIIATRHALRRGRNNMLFRGIYKRVDAHIFVSNAAYDRFCHSWWGQRSPIDSRRIHILHNSLNVVLDAPLPEPERGPVTALYQGAVVEGKGLETLIDALRMLKNIKLRLVISGIGNPDFLDTLRRRAMAGGVMEMIDWHVSSLSAIDAVDAVGGCHFGVMPSVEREAFGMGNLRFMACGRAQVCTSGGAQTEYLKDGRSAIIIPAADASRLAEAMRKLATDTGLRHELAKNAFDDFVNLHSWKSFIENLDKIYKIYN